MPQVTIKDVYDVVNNRMDRLEDKFDTELKGLDTRVTAVENTNSNIMGKIGVGVAGLSIIFSAIVSVVVDYLKGHKA
jgi:hypothetical protein